MSDNRVGSFCPEHGINCKIDDDGTCSACGASAVGTALDEIERLKARVEELKKSNMDRFVDQFSHELFPKMEEDDEQLQHEILDREDEYVCDPWCPDCKEDEDDQEAH